jgi:hypothetical protein
MHRSGDRLSDIELGSFLEGKTSPRQKDSIERRLAACADCRKELDTIRSVVSGEETVENDAPEYLIKKAVKMFPASGGLFDVVLKLLSDSLNIIKSSDTVSILTPNAAPALRNIKVVNPNMIILTKSFTDIEAEMSVEKVLGDMCNVKVLSLRAGNWPL